MCRVPPDQRQNLCPPRPWPFRTHQYTQQKIKEQEKHGAAKREDSWVHPINNRELHLVKNAQWSLSPADWALSRFNGRRQTLHLRKNYWCRASTMAFELGLDDFIPALAAFVQDRRNRVDQIFDEDQLDKRQKDTSWVEVLPVSLQSFNCMLEARWQRLSKHRETRL